MDTKHLGSISRRGLLRGLAATALAAPFTSFVGERARAAGSPAKRLVVVFSPNGTVHARRRPVGTETSFTFPSGSILEPLRAWRDRLVVIDGLRFADTSNHEAGMAAMLTGNGRTTDPSGGMSIDQFVARAIGSTTRFSSLELGVQTSAWGANVQTRMSYAAPGVYVPPMDDPGEVLRRVFAGTVVGSDADAVLRGRRSMLDHLLAETNALRAAVPTREAAKLDVHLDALRSMERALGTGGSGAACSAPTLGAFDPMDNDAFPAVGRAQIDLLVAALACDATRVATLQFSHTVSPTVCSWVGVGDGHHALSHVDDANPAGVDDFVKTERYFAGEFAYLLDRLRAMPEGSGTMLDHTLVVWAKELGDARLHECTDVPFVLAGGTDFLRTGRYLRLDGEPHTKLLVSVCRMMGLANETFGDARVSSGVLGGLS